MKIRSRGFAMLLILPLLAATMACRNPMAPSKSADAGLPPVGIVSLKISPIAPVVADLLATSDLSRLRSVASARAFLAATKVHVRLSGSTGSVQWDEYLDPAALSFAQSGMGVAPRVTTRSVPVGSYTASVDIYNTSSDLYNPVSSGSTAEPFSVTAGASTEVLVRCLPNNPVSVAKGVASDPLELAVAWEVISSDPLEFAPGSEQWISVALAGGTETQVTVAPTPDSEWTGGAFVFDPYGSPVTGGGSGSSDPAAYLYFTPQYTGDYYIGVMGAAGSFTVLVENVEIEAPTAAFNVTPALSVAVGTEITLDGTPSSDPQSYPLSYLWSLGVPAGSSAQLSASDQPVVTFTPDLAGEYSVALRVTASSAAAQWDETSTTITGDNPPPSVDDVVGGDGEA